jgi:hypothetical protein
MMTKSDPDFCFCTLALGSPYRLMAKQLAEDLKIHASGTYLVVGTDNPKDFQDQDNILCFEHHQQSLLHCYNDKRIIIEKSFEKFSSAIYIDADTRIVKPLPTDIYFTPGIIGCHQNLVKHMTKHRPHDLENLKKVSNKLSINISESDWIGESLFVITKDEGREEEFLAVWKLLANYLELRGMNSGEGNIMGLAANKVGWIIDKEQLWPRLQQSTQHLDFSKQTSKKSYWSIFKKKMGYYFRLTKMLIISLMDINFYYL